jgi:oxygen-independent coproporphyrinogen-3 oxidase
MTATATDDKTDVGNYFIANYPPFSFWEKEHLPAIERAFATPAAAKTPLGLYMHIPFCRKRCKFCYFRVYTDVNAEAIQKYVDALATEIAMLAETPAVAGRPVQFAYFGGGTPSYLSVRQLKGLAERLEKSIGWNKAAEVTFECEPGTLQEPKVAALKELGVTRLSLGVENFSDAILEENGRAHLSGEIYRSWDWIKAAGFAQVNIDLIAGMVGETWDNWKENIRKTVELDPDSVTIYQMELPFNTKYAKDLQISGQTPIAPWTTKRDWLNYAFDTLQAAGYSVSSAYTLAKKKSAGNSSFLYRDSLWHGADLLGSGVASFGHLSGIHYQNVDGLEAYQGMLSEGKLPLGRALPVPADERLIREMILQMKVGSLDAGYFRNKFGREIFEVFKGQFDELKSEGYAEIDGDRLELKRDGLLRVDSLLPRFFKPEHSGARYT